MKRMKMITDEDRRAKTAVYDVFPGMYVMKVDYKIPGFIEERKKSNNLEINFCVSGRFECEFTERDIGILRPGDMAVSMFDGENGTKSYTQFPMGFYEGICVIADCGRATEWMETYLGSLAVDLNLLKKRLLSKHWYWAGEAGLRCEHVFREIYDSIEYEEEAFIQLKLVELFMLMSKLPQTDRRDFYYPRRQIEMVKHIRDHIITDSDYYSSVEQLARDHGLSAPQLQKLFREVYGMPIYKYLKEYRLEQAAVNLINTDHPIMELALNAGFSNASKFSQEFKKRYGMTPTRYRRENKN